MRGYLIKSPDGYQAIEQVDMAEPTVGDNDVLVKMRAASLNYRDLGIARGGYSRNDACPVIPLSDGAGEVIAVGQNVTRFSAGDRVIGTFVQDWTDGRPNDSVLRTSLGGGIDGVLVEQQVFPEHGLVRVPDSLNDAEAACLPCAAVTAWHALFEAGGLQQGQTVLTLGTGGVSVFATQLALKAGCRVIATSSSNDKLARMRSLGVTDLINYRENEDWPAVVLELTNGRGADQVVEVGGPGTLAKSVQATSVGGHIGLIGVLAGTGGQVNPLPALFNVITISGIYVGSRAMTERLVGFMDEHDLHPVIDKTFRFADAIDAYAYLRSGEHVGKVVIEFD